MSGDDDSALGIDDSIEDVGSFLRLAARIADSAPAAVERDRKGDRVGPFVIAQKVGHGGMGVVYSASDAQGARVALKVLPAALLADPSYGERFMAEAQALASLDHPAIVRHVAHGTSASGEPYLAMEWLEGEDLGARLGRLRLLGEEAALPVEGCLSLAAGVIGALAAAHERGIVHRDIKPSNLFLCGGDPARVKVLDFGIARVERAARAFTATGAVIGTPGYMAPEQARGEPALDARADLFSLGAVLFECLSGRQAFTGHNAMAILAKLLLEEPSLAELRPDLPFDIVSLVRRMLAKSPAARPESAGAVERELRLIGERMRLGAAAGVDPAAMTLPALKRRPAEPLGGAPRMGAERRFLFLVAARWTEEPAVAPGTDGTGSGAATLDRVMKEGSALGIRVDQLVDGSLLASLSGEGNPLDQVVRAARFALLLRSAAPALSIALVAGQGDPSAALPVGPAVDRAAELVRVAGRGIRLDDTTAAMLEARFEVAGAPPELLGEHEFGEGVRRLLGRPSPCVGRERELRALGDLLSECIDEGVARPVLVTAPAGAGKSRLRHELLAAVKLRRDSVEVWLGSGDPMRAGSPYSLLSSALARVCELRAGELPEGRRLKLRSRVARHVGGADQARVSAFLGEICGTPFEPEAAPRLDEARRSRAVMVEEIGRAWEDFVAAERAAGPLLIVLEDVHWADAASIKLLDAVLAEAQDRPLMVLALARPEVHDRFPRLWSERGVQEIRLPELTRRAAEKLVRHALGERADAAQLARIVERAAGHAFYLEELIRAVAAGHAETLPETVLAMVQSRLDRLGGEARRVLRAASVFGEVFWQSGVLALLGGSAAEQGEARSLMDLLVEREIFTRYRGAGRFPGEAQLAFRHALLQGGAYAMLAEPDLLAGHRLAAEWLEAAGEDDPMVLAEHFDRGGLRAKAAAYYLRAGERALAVGDLTASLARAEQGLACGPAGEMRADLLRVVGESLAMSGNWAGAMPYAEEILQTSPPGSRAYCSALQGRLLMALRLNEPGFIRDALARGHEIALTPENAGLMAQVLSVLYSVLVLVEQHELAEQCYERMESAVAIGEESGQRGAAHRLWARHVRTLYRDADPWAALAESLAARAEFERAKDVMQEVIQRANAAAVYRYLGAYDGVEELLRPVLGAAGLDGHAASIARAQLAQCLAERGALEEATQQAARLIDDARASHDASREYWGRVVLASVHLTRGEGAAAEAEARAAFAQAVQVPAAFVETRTLLAAALLAQGRLPEALAAAREALQRLDGMRSALLLAPLTRLTAVDVLWAAGEHGEANQALRIARDQLLAIALKIPDEAARRGFLEGVAVHARTLALGRERLG